MKLRFEGNGSNQCLQLCAHIKSRVYEVPTLNPMSFLFYTKSAIISGVACKREWAIWMGRCGMDIIKLSHKSPSAKEWTTRKSTGKSELKASVAVDVSEMAWNLSHWQDDNVWKVLWDGPMGQEQTKDQVTTLHQKTKQDSKRGMLLEKRRRTSTKVPPQKQLCCFADNSRAAATGSAHFKIDLKIGLIKVESF